MSDEESATEKPNGKGKNSRGYPPWWDQGESIRAIGKELNLNQNVVSRLLHEAGIEGATSADGTFRRYPPGTALKLQPLVNLSDQAQSARVDRGLDPGKDVIDGGTALLKQAHTHIERVFGLVIQPMARALDALEKSNERLTDRCGKLEADRDKVADERERLLNEASYRAMAEKQVEGEEKRKEEAWGLLLRGVPTIVEQVKKSIISGDPKVKEQVNAAIDLLQSISPDQLEALTAIEFLTPEQRANVERILKHRPDKGAKEHRPAEPASTNERK